jgi:glyoxylase-like metal-dependent hydrolase (beta-lactamase superfamily II)
MTELVFPFDTGPKPAELREVANDVFWLQMPLPMSLNHINLYMIKDDDGWTVIDTGIRGQETRDLWLQIFDTQLDNLPVKQIICTHMHPDHTGQAGFIHQHFQAPLLMSYGEYYQARVMMSQIQGGANHWQSSSHYERNGIAPEFLEEIARSRSDFAPEPEDHPFPAAFIRLTEGQALTLGGTDWQVITGTGHSPEHVCLYSQERRLLISGDQVLPIITSNVSVHPTEPMANPMSGWIASHEKLKRLLPNDVLVLPAHNLPFYGLHERLDELIEHHEERMLIIEQACQTPQKGVDLLPALFDRELTGTTKLMALGECVAHIHCLMARDRIKQSFDGRHYFYESIATDLAQRLPDEPLAKDEAPLQV